MPDQEQQADEGIILHRDGVIIDMDEGTAAIFGYERSEVVGRMLEELIPDYEKPPAPSSAAPPPAAVKPLPVAHAPGQNEEAKKTVALRKHGLPFEVAIERQSAPGALNGAAATQATRPRQS